MSTSSSRYAAYIRVSTEDQAERGNLDNQRQFAEKYCDLHQIRLVATFADDGVSGTFPLERRPAGAELLAAAKLKQFDVLLIVHLDRLGRQSRLILNAIHELEECGVTVQSMTQNFNTADATGRMMLEMLAVFAGFERAMFLERSRLGTERVARMGKWLGGIVPFGYRVDEDGYLHISEEPIPGCEHSEAGVIRLMYHLAADEGWTCLRIAQYLNGLKIPPRYVIANLEKKERGKRVKATDGVWRPGRIRNTLVEPTYKGEHTYGRRSTKRKEVITREVPAIVSAETWAAAQATLRSNFIEAFRNQKRRYLLRGLITCAACGRVYHGTSYPDGHRGKKTFYICGGKQKSNVYPSESCTAKNLAAEEIEAHVWGECVRILTEPAAAEAYLQAHQPEAPDGEDVAREAHTLISALEENTKERERVVTLYRRGLIDDDELTTQLRQVDGEREAIKQRQEALDRRLRRQTAQDDRTANAQAVLDRLRPLLALDDFDARREIVTALVDHITVTTIGEGTGNAARWHVRAEVEICYRMAELIKVVK